MSESMPVAWTFSPRWVAAIILVAIEEIGLMRLRARSRPERAWVWRRRALCEQRIDVHFLEPVGLRRRLVGGWQLGRARWLTRRISAMVAAPLFGLILFNATMLAWHLPVVMDWAGRNAWAHTWVMTVSFVGSGYLFWRIILPSHPSPPRGRLGMQAISIVVTAFGMLFLAVAMAVMSRGAWYQMNITMLGAHQAFHDQQVAAGILWICGDFWWIPAIVLVVRRLMLREGSLGAAFERSLGREV